MTTCTQARDLFSLHLEGDLDNDRVLWLEGHLEQCDECRTLLRDFADLFDAAGPMTHLDPPDHLAEELSSSPCRRWLGLLYSAVDREISEANLDRLFHHLESCEDCRRAWADLSLIHQVSDVIEPPQHLRARCIRPRRQATTRSILGRRTATAAAYALAILASLVLGNPVSLARHDAAETVQKVSQAVGADFGGVARTSRGEARVMLWRAVTLGRRAADAFNTTWSRITGGPESGDDAEGQDEPTAQGHPGSSGPSPAASGQSSTAGFFREQTTGWQLALPPGALAADEEKRS